MTLKYMQRKREVNTMFFFKAEFTTPRKTPHTITKLTQLYQYVECGRVRKNVACLPGSNIWTNVYEQFAQQCGPG